MCYCLVTGTILFLIPPKSTLVLVDTVACKWDTYKNPSIPFSNPTYPITRIFVLPNTIDIWGEGDATAKGKHVLGFWVMWSAEQRADTM